MARSTLTRPLPRTRRCQDKWPQPPHTPGPEPRALKAYSLLAADTRQPRQLPRVQNPMPAAACPAALLAASARPRLQPCIGILPASPRLSTSIPGTDGIHYSVFLSAHLCGKAVPEACTEAEAAALTGVLGGVCSECPAACGLAILAVMIAADDAVLG